MKSFKQHIVQTKIWKALLESSSPRDILLLLENPSNLLKNLIKNHLEDLDDVDRLKEIYRSIAGPVVRQKARQLFADRGMSDGKGVAAADQLGQKLNDATLIPQHKISLLDELSQGKAIDIEQIVEDARSSLTYMSSSKYVTGNSPLLKDARFYSWFWNWEPPMGSRAVGGGEMAMILSVPGAKKGGEKGGDVVLPNMAIEMKKAVEEGKTGGAGFGDVKNWDAGKRKYLAHINKSNLPDEIKNQAELLGFGGSKSTSLFKGEITSTTDPANRFSASMNAISIPFIQTHEKGYTEAVSDFADMWDDVIETCQGKSPSFAYSRYMSGTGMINSDGAIDVNKFMHVWVANGIDAYREKEGFDVLFLYDPGSLSAVAFKSGLDFIKSQFRGNGNISYDWAASWSKTGMGYEQYVPRLKVKKYQNVPLIRGVDGIKSLTNDYLAHTVFYNYLKDPLNAKSPKVDKNLKKIGEIAGIRNIASDMKTKPVDVIKQLVKYYDDAVKNTSAAGLNASRIKIIKAGLADLIIWANKQ